MPLGRLLVPCRSRRNRWTGTCRWWDSHARRLAARPTLHLFLTLAGWLLAGMAAAQSTDPAARQAAQTPDAELVEFFETKVRPVLAGHCFECHGSQKQEAGLRLDSPEAALRGSDNGPVIVPGQPDASRLIQAIGYQDNELQMPPDEPLAAAVVRDLTHWVQSGATWPKADQPPVPGKSEAWRQHWAFQPVRRPPWPAVNNADWARTPIDLFVLAALEQVGLDPSPPADPQVLIRRMTYDLTGLPPTPQEIDRFLADRAPDAWERLIDRLLASPHYGERWGRHWLDVARYADNKGYKFFGSDEFHAYTYRDWVVRAFNEDLPYDQFIVQQLAADRLPLGDDTRPLAAMGYLTVGRRFLEDIHDIIDDRIDVVTRGLLGLTVTCARCHDHKYDPIPSADYYSLYGVFAGSFESTRTLAVAWQQSEAEQAFRAELEVREAKLAAYLETRHAELLVTFRSQVAEYLLEGHKAQSQPPTDKFMFVEEPGKLSQYVIGNWRAFLDRSQKGHDPVLAPWHAFAALGDAEFERQAPSVAGRFAANADPERPINALVARMFEGPPPADLAEVARRYGGLLADVDRQWREIVAAAASPEAVPRTFDDDSLEGLRRVLYGPLAPMDVSLADVEFLIGRPGQAEVAELRKKIAEWRGSSNVHLPRAMTLEELPPHRIYNPRIFVRGKPANLGDEVPRQFLGVLAGNERQPFEHGSGRLELAQAIADGGNPLTARVMVNRVWLHHFGAGLVRTPSDFGLRSQPPSHPELLDWLAAEFVEQGWSLKQLHRQILLSSTYGQSSHDRAEAAGIDPENRLLWKTNRRRLDLEALRDSLLAVSGQLDRTPGGLPAELLGKRRTVYAFIDRQNLPGLLQVFDFAIPDTHSPQRFVTTVPQQALFLMNSSFAVEQARQLAQRALAAAPDSLDERIEQLYRLVYGRGAAADEVQLAKDFLQAGGADRVGEGDAARDVSSRELSAWERYAHALLLTNEFVFVD